MCTPQTCFSRAFRSGQEDPFHTGVSPLRVMISVSMSRMATDTPHKALAVSDCLAHLPEKHQSLPIKTDHQSEAEENIWGPKPPSSSLQRSGEVSLQPLGVELGCCADMGRAERSIRQSYHIRPRRRCHCHPHHSVKTSVSCCQRPKIKMHECATFCGRSCFVIITGIEVVNVACILA